MNNFSKLLSLVTLLSLLTVSCSKSIRIGNGLTHDGPLTIVNGAITIGNECTVTGNSRTVNGSITVGDNSDVGELQTTNGSIQIGSNTSVDGGVITINGVIVCNLGSQVDGTLSTINGSITLIGTSVTGNLKTITGHIRLARGSKVQGDIVIRSRSGSPNIKQPLVIKLSGSSVVEGDIINNDDRLDVQVILADDSKVLGEIKNAEVRRQ